MAINTNIGSSLMRFNFLDDSGEVVASFRLNPADVRLVKRFEELGDYFASLENIVDSDADIDAVISRNSEIENKISELLGYDASVQLFGFVPATTTMADGRLFVIHVLEKMQEAVEPEISKRKEAMMAAVEKYTAKYD